MPNKNYILDTNIWVSFFIKARFEELVHLIFDHELQVYSCQELIDELENVLSRKKFAQYLTLPIGEYINFHRNLVTIVKTQAIYKDCPDPKDNFLFDLALQSNAKIIVTGDKILLDLPENPLLQIISLATFKTLIKE